MHHVTYIFFCCHAAFNIWATMWQLKLIQHGNCSCCHMANTVHYTWQLDLPHHVTCIFCFHVVFFHTAIIWQVELTQHGNCSCCDMATTVQLDGNYSATTWQLYLLCHSDCSWTTHGNCPTFSTYISHHGPLPPHNPSVFGFYMYPNPLFFYIHCSHP